MPSRRETPSELFGSLSGGGCLDELVDAEVVLARVLENGEALAAGVLLRGRDSQRGDGSHDLSIKTRFRLLYLTGTEHGIGVFHMTEVSGQNGVCY